jgi:hypothetical protein
VPALAPAASASLPVPALAPAASLSVMARQYLGVPATSASAERLFSLAGRAFDDLRQCMKEEMLEILMWARINKEKTSEGIKDAAASTPPQLRSSRYIRYRDNIGYPRYGESFHHIGDNRYYRDI